jgi:enamine deaminase RidA (YjgF/YER057c/UK114 family)
MTTPEQRLADLGIVLPAPAKPVANYLGYMQAGSLVFTAGQLPYVDGVVGTTGLLGVSVTREEGKRAARHAAINVLAQVNAACAGDLSRVRRVVKLTGFVACLGSFTEQPFVVNGASDLMVEVFGDAGRHARSAIGVASLPLNACVEIEGIFDIG